MKGKMEIKLKRIVEILAKKYVQGLKTAIILDPKLLLLPKQRSAYSTRLTFSYHNMEELIQIIKEILHFTHVISKLSINFSAKMLKTWRISPYLLKEQLQLVIEGGDYLYDFADRFNEQFLYAWLQSLPKIKLNDETKVKNNPLLWETKDLGTAKAGFNAANYCKFGYELLENTAGIVMHDSVTQEPYQASAEVKCGGAIVDDIFNKPLKTPLNAIANAKNRIICLKNRGKKTDRGDG